MLNQQSYSCPKCHLLDRVQKISAIVASGTVAGIYSNISGFHVSAGFSQTAKALELSPPRVPTYTESPWGSVTSSFMLILCFTLALSLPTIPLVFIFPGNLSAAVKLFSAIGCAIVSVICIIIILRLIRGKNKVNLARQEQCRIDKLRWERAKSWWDQLYYCERDDLVFLPNSPNFYAPALQMWSLCERL